jgi:hypothetical protein
MTFRQFLEQGTKKTATGHNAGGRAGQKQWTPERMKGPLPKPTMDPMRNNYRGPKTKKFIPPQPPKIGNI